MHFKRVKTNVGLELTIFDVNGNVFSQAAVHFDRLGVEELTLLIKILELAQCR